MAKTAENYAELCRILGIPDNSKNRISKRKAKIRAESKIKKIYSVQDDSCSDSDSRDYEPRQDDVDSHSEFEYDDSEDFCELK